MVVEECLNISAELFEPVPQNVLMHPVDQVFSGPGGSWQVAFWLDRPDKARSAIVPLDGGKPVALKATWEDTQRAVGAAIAFAKIAAEV